MTERGAGNGIIRGVLQISKKKTVISILLVCLFPKHSHDRKPNKLLPLLATIDAEFRSMLCVAA